MYELYSENKVSNNNFIILPCDLITNLPPQVIIEAYRNKNDSDLGLVIAYKNQLDIEDKRRKFSLKVIPSIVTLMRMGMKVQCFGHIQPSRY